MNILTVAASALLSLSGAAAAQDRILEDMAVQTPTQKSGMELLACYTSAAMLYGRQTCEPAASLVDAVFGRCAKEEVDVRRGVEADPKYKGVERSVTIQLSEAIIKRIRESQRGKVQSVILDMRIGSNKRCP